MLEVLVPDGEPRIPASLWQRPPWVTELGIYGRAAYEWRRAHVPMSLDLLEDPVTMFRTIDQTVSDRVRVIVQAWLRARGDTTTVVENLPQEFAESAEDQLLAATRAAEIGPCLELVYRPAPEAPGDLLEGTKPTPYEIELLGTTTWEARLELVDYRLVAIELAEALAEGDTSDSLTRNDYPPLTNPTSMFPTEVRVATQQLTASLGRPVDLYVLFN